MMSEEQTVAGVLAVLDRAIAEAEHKPGEWSAEPGTICAPWARFSYARDGQLAMAAVNSLPVLMATVRCQAAELERIRAMEEDRPTDAMLDDMRRHGLSIDGDNAYKRDLIDCIVGALAFGKQGVNPPPAGHWAQQFWEMGRAEGEIQEQLAATAAPAQVAQELMPDEIHQMAFEEAQPADNGDGYLFTAEEFDLFVERLLTRTAQPAAEQPTWGYAKTIGNLIAQLRTLDPSTRIYAPHRLDDGRVALDGLMLSKEWKTGRFLKAGDEAERVAVLWTQPDVRPAQSDQPDMQAMVSRFLAWPLPTSVQADPCALDPAYPHRHGTNLLTASEAQAMLEHVLAENPPSSRP